MTTKYAPVKGRSGVNHLHRAVHHRQCDRASVGTCGGTGPIDHPLPGISCGEPETPVAFTMSARVVRSEHKNVTAGFRIQEQGVIAVRGQKLGTHDQILVVGGKANGGPGWDRSNKEAPGTL